jgi:hypothetical protein
MIDLVTLQIVRDFVAIFGVIAGFTYYVLIVRNNQRNQRMVLENRKAQLFMPIYSLLHRQEFAKQTGDFIYNWEWSDVSDFMEKYGPATNLEQFTSFLNMLAFYHAVGGLLMMEQIDPEMVHSLLPNTPITIWEKAESIVHQMREQTSSPNLFQGAEYLYKEMKKRQNENS